MQTIYFKIISSNQIFFFIPFSFFTNHLQVYTNRTKQKNWEFISPFCLII